MPTFDFDSTNDAVNTSWDGPSGSTMTVTINPGSTQATGKPTSSSSGSMSGGVIAAVVVVSVLVAVCVATAAVLHMWWCMHPRCKACFVMRCGRRKPQKGGHRGGWGKRIPSLPTTTTSIDKAPSSPEEVGGSIFDPSPLDRHFRHLRPVSEGASTLVTQPRLQEIGGSKPRYFYANSIVSNVAQVTTPNTESPPTAPTVASTSSRQTEQPDQEPAERSEDGEHHPPSSFGAALFNTARSRASHASGFLSIITLPSFIATDRPRTYSSGGAKMESPVHPQTHHRKRSSLFGKRVSATDAVPPISPGNDEDTRGKRSRPTSALQIFTSALKRSGSNSSLRSSSPSSRRSSRRSLGRRNPSLGIEEEAVIQWKKLPPIPPPVQNRQSQRESQVEDLSKEPLPSYSEREPKPQLFLAPLVPLPPSPSTLASSVSSLTYAPPSPEEIPPINGFTTPYASYPPLPPSIPSTPTPFGPSPTPTPRSTDRFVDTPTDRTLARSVSPGKSALRGLFTEVCQTQSDEDSPATVVPPPFPGSSDDSLSRGSSDGGTETSTHRRSGSSEYSQISTVQELVMPPMPVLTYPSSLSPPMSPRGPRPRPLPSLSRSGTLYSQTSSNGQ